MEKEEEEKINWTKSRYNNLVICIQIFCLLLAENQEHDDDEEEEEEVEREE